MSGEGFMSEFDIDSPTVADGSEWFLKEWVTGQLPLQSWPQLRYCGLRGFSGSYEAVCANGQWQWVHEQYLY